MDFRNIIIQSKARLSKYHGFLVIHLKKNIYQVPFNDINMVIIDNLWSYITTAAVLALSQNKCLIIICDEHHLPRCLILPCNTYYHRLPIIKSQLRLPNKIRGRIWQKIIKRKLLNEELVLQYVNKPFNDIDILRRHVILYDRKGCEAIAAKIYFERLFGKTFVRRNSSTINSALNYGYSIIRSLIAKNICIHGLEPSIGIWHCNKLNNFNLADDLIEPFRSIVDLYVYNNRKTYIDILTKRNRISLVKLIIQRTVINHQYQSIHKAVSLEVSSFNTCCLNRSTRILLPRLTK